MCPGFNGSLRDYQLKGVKWLISLWSNGLNGILADQARAARCCFMGAGWGAARVTGRCAACRPFSCAASCVGDVPCCCPILCRAGLGRPPVPRCLPGVRRCTCWPPAAVHTWMPPAATPLAHQLATLRLHPADGPGQDGSDHRLPVPPAQRGPHQRPLHGALRCVRCAALWALGTAGGRVLRARAARCCTQPLLGTYHCSDCARLTDSPEMLPLPPCRCWARCPR